ncbi:MAG TPA: PIN domain-containing protein [Solirubrobacterales bacterium]|nr:PIN domain-containing protein [Solirubrobacterales bacterium]
MLLLDSSIWIAAKDADERHSEAARALILSTGLQVTALDLTLYEVANVVGARWGRPEWARELCRTIQLRCAERISSVGTDLIDPTIAVAAEHGLSAYDAAYVAAARRHDWTLVSVDIADLVSKGLAVTPGDAV